MKLLYHLFETKPFENYIKRAAEDSFEWRKVDEAMMPGDGKYSITLL